MIVVEAKWRFYLSLALFGSVTATIPFPLAAQSICVQEIEIPGNQPTGTIVRRDLAIDPDGIIWFTQLELNQIGKYDPQTGQFKFFDIPTPDSGPHSLDVDSQGVVWFSETSGHQLGRFDPISNTFNEESTPTPQGKPYGIAIDASDDVWFTDMTAVSVVRRSGTTGQMTEFPLDPATDSVENLTVDPATGDVWVADLANGKLIRLNPNTGQITRFKIPFFGSAPHSVAVDGKGRVWFSDVIRRHIGRLDPVTGLFTRVRTRTRRPTSHGIIVDSRGLVWFTELQGNKIGLIIPQLSDLLVELSLVTADSGPYFIAQAPDREIWFIAADAPILGRLPCTAF